MPFLITVPPPLQFLHLFLLKIQRKYQAIVVYLVQWLYSEGYSNYFLIGCAARGLKPLPKTKDFSPSKNGWFDCFSEIFHKSGPISKGFSISKPADFKIIFALFVKWDPLLRIFLTRIGSFSKDFWQKSNPFGGHIPVCLNMRVPPWALLLLLW